MHRDANPVLRGSQPDPSVCRFGDEYVLVTSSMVLFPGIPVHRSTDLVTWRLASHVIDRPERLAGTGPNAEDGVWAPTIRYHDGLLHVVYTISVGRSHHRTLLSSAPDPAGPWSDPVELDADGFDPSLFFDTDGRAWLTGCRDTTQEDEGPGEIWLRELDLAESRLVGPTTVLWHGSARGAWIEAPHLYRRGDRYVLIAAEGGTERGHAVVAAAADRITGPYRSDPRNPLLTHRHLGEEVRFQNIGHADLVAAPDGRTWAVVLGVRTTAGYHTTGRETFVVPVEWQDDRPVFAPGTGRVDTAVGSTEQVSHEVRAPLDWVTLRGPIERSMSGAEMLVRPIPLDLAEGGTPAFVAVRQDEPEFSLRATVSVAEGDVAAGLALFHHHDRFATIRVEHRATGSEVRCELREDGRLRVLGRAAPVGDPELWIASDGERVRFGVGPDALADVPARLFSAEDAGGFGGTLVGVSATGPATATPVAFRGVHYARSRSFEPGPAALPDPVDA